MLPGLLLLIVLSRHRCIVYNALRRGGLVVRSLHRCMLGKGLRLRARLSACHFLATVRGFLRLVNFPKCCYVSVQSLVTLWNVDVVRGSCQVTRVICSCNNTPCLWITHNDLPRSDKRMYLPCLIVSF